MLVCASCGHANSEGAKFCEECAAPLAAAPAAREQRKTVTVLFCDVTGSTSLGESTDPEALRAVLARYFERMKGIVESHGGAVEKFIGDAVMAVFGVPILHEDDALRVLRAAVEMRAALPELGIQARIGVMTGEVVTGTEERLAVQRRQSPSAHGCRRVRGTGRMVRCRPEEEGAVRRRFTRGNKALAVAPKSDRTRDRDLPATTAPSNRTL